MISRAKIRILHQRLAISYLNKLGPDQSVSKEWRGKLFLENIKLPFCTDPYLDESRAMSSAVEVIICLLGCEFPPVNNPRRSNDFEDVKQVSISIHEVDGKHFQSSLKTKGQK